MAAAMVSWFLAPGLLFSPATIFLCPESGPSLSSVCFEFSRVIDGGSQARTCICTRPGTRKSYRSINASCVPSINPEIYHVTTPNLTVGVQETAVKSMITNRDRVLPPNPIQNYFKIYVATTIFLQKCLRSN